MKKIKIVVDEEKGPMLSFEGFTFTTEVIMLLQIGIEILQEQIKNKMKSNLVKPVGPFIVKE